MKTIDMSTYYYWSLMLPIITKMQQYQALAKLGDMKNAMSIQCDTKTLPEFYKLYGEMSIWCSINTTGFYWINDCHIFHFDEDVDAMAFKLRWT